MRAPFQLLDAQAALAFVISQATHIERGVNAIVYPDIQYPELVPVDTSANPWAKTVTYFSSDKYGKAGWINGNADDIPRAGTELSKFETSVYTAGIGYGFGLEDISQAQMLGYNLDAEEASAARRAYEEMVDRVAIYGDAEKNFYGLINCPAVTAGSATFGNWLTATSDKILADVNNALTGQAQGTLYIVVADTLLIPQAHWNLIATRMVTELSTQTILAWLQQNNAYTAKTGRPLTIRAVRGLEKAGAGGTARMVAYRRDPSVVKMHMPMPHRFLPVYQAGPLRFEVPGIFRLGGVDVRQPTQMRYIDGI
ncbi:major capsid family protein [Pseudomonas benzopyrenica]|uniref:Major capsid family protein n=1 Tax=Pseudomonas benzopyrenica TaxID=2993566 RepID=A0ABZ2FWX1_9PSED